MKVILKNILIRPLKVQMQLLKEKVILKISDACLSPSCPWRDTFGSGQESSHIKVSFLELLKDLYFILFLGFNLSTCSYKQSFSITGAWKHWAFQRKRWRAWALLLAKSTLDVEINNHSCFFPKTLKYIYFLLSLFPSSLAPQSALLKR